MSKRFELIKEAIVTVLTEAEKLPVDFTDDERKAKGMRSRKGLTRDEIMKGVLAGEFKPATADEHLALHAHLTKLFGENDPDASTFPEGHPAIPIYGKFDPRYNPVKSPAAQARGREMSASMSRGIHLHAHSDADRAKKEALKKGASPQKAEEVYRAAYEKAHAYWSK